MKKLTKDQVKHVAKLANLQIAEAEIAKFAKQLTAILDYIAKLNQVKTGKVSPLAHAAGIKNITRDDLTEPSLSSNDALSNAPSVHNDLLKVKAILEQ